ncbi:uncharacterized protein LOC135849685 [Planococcus citri]|uniref:uncharacterized protein LOC135849685 n=1 Tax=Planococcus citri TaxID=170843 RepID=UPI0031F84A48
MPQNIHINRVPSEEEPKLENGAIPQPKVTNDANPRICYNPNDIHLQVQERKTSRRVKVAVLFCLLIAAYVLLNRRSCDRYFSKEDLIDMQFPSEWNKVHSWNDLLFSQFRNKYGWMINNIWTVESTDSKSPKQHCRIPLIFRKAESIVYHNSKIRNRMISRWPPDYNKQYTYGHTCATQIEPLDSEYKFLNQGAEWHDYYNINETLGKCHIVPSDSKMYNYTQVHDCFMKRFNVEIKIGCRNETISTRHTLYEFGFCFDQSLNLKNCTNVGDSYLGFQYCGEEFTYPITFPF